MYFACHKRYKTIRCLSTAQQQVARQPQSICPFARPRSSSRQGGVSDSSKGIIYRLCVASYDRLCDMKDKKDPNQGVQQGTVGIGGRHTLPHAQTPHILWSRSGSQFPERQGDADGRSGHTLQPARSRKRLLHVHLHSTSTLALRRRSRPAQPAVLASSFFLTIAQQKQCAAGCTREVEPWPQTLLPLILGRVRGRAQLDGRITMSCTAQLRQA